MSAAAGAAALVMARAPIPGRCKTRLEPLLGPEGCARLQAGLIRRAATWAHEVAPGAAWVAFDPSGREEEVRARVPAGTRLFAQEGADLGERLTAASARVLAEHPGPLLVAGTDLPRLSARHAAAALSDLAAGCDVSLGPALDGGWYLMGVRQAQPALFALPSEAWGGPEVWSLTLAAAEAQGLGLGLLRAERDLDTPEDARAMLADPALPPEVAELLHPG